MNREIKFRGKRKDNGEWKYGWYVKCRRHHYILPIHNIDDPNLFFDERWIQEGGDEDNWFEVDPETVSQYIGCNDDKDKKDMYTGDIVLLYDNVIHEGTHVVIEWLQNRLGFFGKFIDGPYKDKYTDLTDTWRKYEVVGNIFDEKEINKE